MSEWEPIPNKTPIGHSDIKPAWIKTRKDLAEAQNVAEAFSKYLTSRPSSKRAPFDYRRHICIIERFTSTRSRTKMVDGHDFLPISGWQATAPQLWLGPRNPKAVFGVVVAPVAYSLTAPTPHPHRTHTAAPPQPHRSPTAAPPCFYQWKGETVTG